MKVLHVIPALAPRYGGPIRAVFEMCRALDRQGVETLIVATDADGRGRLAVQLGRPIVYEGARAIFFLRQWSEAFKYSHPLARWLMAHVRDFDLVEIHAVFSHSSLAAARACRTRRVPYIVRPAGALAPWSLRQKRLAKHLLWHLGVKQMLGGAAAIHYTTAAERTEAEATLRPGRGIVVPLGVDEEILNAPLIPDGFRSRYPLMGEDPYVLMLCRLHPKKGVHLFLDAFLEVVRRGEFRHWRLVLAGNGEPRYVGSLKRLVAEQGGDGHVFFTGWLEGSEKIAALQGAALFALPSYQENFALSVAEALACGVPVLISCHVNLAEQVLAAGAGWIVSLDRDALVGALVEALRSEEERAARGAAGRAFARSRFTWSAAVRELTQHYRSVVAGASRVVSPRRA